MTPPSESLQAWEGLATQACIQLLEVCTSHPNQKKVFTAVVTKQLLLLLSQAIWRSDNDALMSDTRHMPVPNVPEGVKNDPGRKSADQLATIATQLLRAVVFHSSSLEGLVELGISFSNEKDSQAADKGTAPHSYHSQLLLVGNQF